MKSLCIAVPLMVDGIQKNNPLRLVSLRLLPQVRPGCEIERRVLLLARGMSNERLSLSSTIS